MFSKVLVLAFFGLACIQGIQAQLTTATIFPGDPNSVDNIKGEIIGTGADGTTYVISGEISATPFTATLVEDSTYISELLVATASSISMKITDECSMDAQREGACTAVVAVNFDGFATTATATATGTISLAPVVLATSKSAASGPYNMALLSITPIISLGLGVLLNA